MTTTDDRPRTPEPPGQDAPSRPIRRRAAWLAPLGRRLHFYAGVLVGPFILVAALTGALYALTPQIERVVYGDELRAPVVDGQVDLTLADQVEAAQAYLGDADVTLSAVRPAPEPGDTTRIMYLQDGLAESESRAVFVDPGTGEIRGDLTVYGTSGALPLRTWIDNLHRGLHLGDAGRLYSELAASWLGVVVLAGVGIWIARYRRTRHRREMVRPSNQRRGYRRIFSWHASTGIWLALGALFLASTGITWSQYAGANVSDLRSAASWATPSLSTAIAADDGAGASASADDHANHTPQEHAEHTGHGGATPDEESAAAAANDPAMFDAVLALGRTVNITTGLVEIKPPAEVGSAWTVNEIQRSYPTQVDGVAIDPASMTVVDRVDFEDYPFVAKLARWGIDMHQGTMFGLVNQLVLFVTAAGIATMVVWGYLMWWKRRPTRGFGAAPEPEAWAAAPWWGRVAVVAVGVLVGLWLPLLGWTLAAFVLVDVLLGLRRRRSTADRT